MNLFTPVNQCPPTDCPPVTSAGPPGRDGDDGAPGADGKNAFSVTTATFEVPSSGGTAVVAVADSSWLGVGSVVHISNAGYWTVITILSAVSIRVSPLAGNPVAGTIVPSGGTVALSGPAGPAGADGVLTGTAGGDLTGTYPNPMIRAIPGLVADTYTKVSVNAAGRVTAGTGLAGNDVPVFIGDSGAGGAQGTVPPPDPGDAARGAVLRASGDWGQTIKYIAPLKSASYTLTMDDEVVLFNTTSGGMTAFLPAVTAADRGSHVTIKKADGTSNLLSVIPDGSDLIDGQSSYPLVTPWSSVSLVCDGTGWVVLNERLPVAPRFFVSFVGAAYVAGATTVLGVGGGNTIDWNNVSAYSDIGPARFTPQVPGKYLIVASVEGDIEAEVPVTLTLYKNGFPLRVLATRYVGLAPETVTISGSTIVQSPGTGDYFDVRVTVGAGSSTDPTLTGTFGADRLSG